MRRLPKPPFAEAGERDMDRLAVRPPGRHAVRPRRRFFPARCARRDADKRTARDERADRVAALAAWLAVPRAALTGHPELETATNRQPALVPSRPFVDPDPFRELVYPSAIEAKRAIADLLGVPLGQLAAEERAAIDAILGETLERGVVLARVRARFAAPCSGGGRC
jgi:hypothetical protein